MDDIFVVQAISFIFYKVSTKRDFSIQWLFVNPRLTWITCYFKSNKTSITSYIKYDNLALTYFPCIVAFGYELHYEKIGWFTTSLAIGFLSCNDHLQLHYNLVYFYSMNILNKLHELQWNYIHMKLM
jgi:hypothetical protein